MPTMDLKLELLPVPVTDVDRAKAFYADRLGFVVDVDDSPMEGIRVVQLTPPGSACSIMVGTGITRSEPGSLQGPQLVVDDIEAAREELADRGLEMSPVQHFEESGLVDGKGGPWNSFVFFNDPDGNGWVLQERPAPEHR
jgi:catechol 2,3-dioxygenase-like lactoylglutathione lyase family enzyme